MKFIFKNSTPVSIPASYVCVATPQSYYRAKDLDKALFWTGVLNTNNKKKYINKNIHPFIHTSIYPLIFF